MTTPYYADEAVTLYHGDCREVTEWLEADVLVTDPPYGRAWKVADGFKNAQGAGTGRTAHPGIANDDSTEVRDAALVMWGAQRLAVVFGDLLIPQPLGAVQACIYEKPVDAGIRGARGGRRRDAEAIYLVGPWPASIGGASSIFRTNGRVAGPRGLSYRNGHPHAKPLDILCQLVGMAPGTVADPFAGSGTTLVAAKQLGRKAIGVEFEERYCDLAARRLAAGVLDFGEASA